MFHSIKSALIAKHTNAFQLKYFSSRLPSQMCCTLSVMLINATFISLLSSSSPAVTLHTPVPWSFSHLRLHSVKFRHQDTRSHPRVEVPLELQKLAHEV